MIEDILLDVWGETGRTPTDFQRNHAYRTARDVERAMAGPKPITYVNATIRAAYFDADNRKSTIATARIMRGE